MATQNISVWKLTDHGVGGSANILYKPQC